MNAHIEFLKRFSAYYRYPAAAEAEFLRVEERLEAEPSFGNELASIVHAYMFPEASGLPEALERMTALAAKYQENTYTMHFVFLLRCARILEDRYEAAGIEKSIYYASCDDFRCKLLECMECKGVPGTFVAFWNQGTFALQRFAYGRFQYELVQYPDKPAFTMSSGHVIRPGDTYVNFHIPASGIPLTDEVRLASYREAYPHFKALFPDGKVLFGCSSWLLYPRHREFLPARSNIIRFMDDFEPVFSEERDSFPDAWRVFGAAADGPLEKLPRDTSLRRAYADWLQAGNKTGHGFGCFLFDGERIIR